MSTYQLTDEQDAIRTAVKIGGNLIVRAGAGAGKTSTLRACAEAMPGRQGLFVAYNGDVKRDAAASFPRNVRCVTSHGLGYRDMVATFGRRMDNKTRVPGREAAQILGINEPVRLDADHKLSPAQVARIAVATVAKFCYSADHEVQRHHTPETKGYESPELHAAIQEMILSYARRAWADAQDPHGGLKFEHDHYLKMWQLQGRKIRKSFLMVDEGQDLNPCVRAIVENQDHMQVVVVGDENQAIYGWRGAEDALRYFADLGYPALTLSQSFRFGPAIADEANVWLRALGTDLRLSGSPWIGSELAELDAPDAILTRSNATALAQVVGLVNAGVPTALAGKNGASELLSLARGAEDLQAGGQTEHPDLHAFSSWAQVREYVETDPLAADLKVLVNLIDDYTPAGIIAVLNRLVPESQAATVVSTAHKAKGREWSSVRIADDFREPPADPVTGWRAPMRRDEAMLLYVSLTRAKQQLDCRTVEWAYDGLVVEPARARIAPAGPTADELVAFVERENAGEPWGEADADLAAKVVAAVIVDDDDWPAPVAPIVGKIYPPEAILPDPPLHDDELEDDAAGVVPTFVVVEPWSLGAAAPGGDDWPEPVAPAEPVEESAGPAPMDPEPAVPAAVALCPRCCGTAGRCPCDPATLARWLDRVGPRTTSPPPGRMAGPQIRSVIDRAQAALSGATS